MEDTLENFIVLQKSGRKTVTIFCFTCSMEILTGLQISLTLFILFRNAGFMSNEPFTSAHLCPEGVLFPQAGSPTLSGICCSSSHCSSNFVGKHQF